MSSDAGVKSHIAGGRNKESAPCHDAKSKWVIYCSVLIIRLTVEWLVLFLHWICVSMIKHTHHHGVALCCGHFYYQRFGWPRVKGDSPFRACLSSIADHAEIFHANIIFVALSICLSPLSNCCFSDLRLSFLRGCVTVITAQQLCLIVG